MRLIYKGAVIEPFEGFYRRASESFFKGTLGGGISRTCKCDDDLTILEVVYEQDNGNGLCLEEPAERSGL